MDEKLKGLRKIMNNTVLKHKQTTDKEKQKIFENAVLGRTQKQRFFMAPLLSSVFIIFFLGSIGAFAYDKLFTSELPHTNDQNVNAQKDSNDVKKTSVEPQSTQDRISWEDVTILESGAHYDMATNAKDYIAGANLSINTPPEKDSKLIQKGFDEMYHYYLTALSIQNGLKIIKVKGREIEEDFDNLYVLTTIIYEEQNKRLDGVNIEGKSKFEAYKYWKEPSDEMKQALDYLGKLLHDLDIWMNHDGNGTTFGYSHLGDGDKIQGMEQFIDSYLGIELE